MEPNNRFTRWEQILLSIGLLGLNVWVWSMVRTAWVQRRENQVFESELRNLDDRPSPLASPGNVQTMPEAPPNGLVGRLSIPRLRLSAIVREGDGAGTLSVALGHIPGTALPGQPGNVCVAGHRDTLFRPLAEIHRDDTIVFETLAGTYQYRVENIHIVKPTDVAVLHATKTPELTLVTCYPFYYVGHAPERYIVKARMVPVIAMQHRAFTQQSFQIPKHHTGTLVAESSH